jgi:hypothetical protein
MFVCFEVKAPTCVTYQASATPLGFFIFFIFLYHISYEEPKRDLTLNDGMFYEPI